ncbi:hypothetical protein AXG93_1356s1140 [Marchantia polymorpha subsp. ruderalis]|uniref:Uncharacterized protein n=1 Tax=Marchantia polymorpha subsp. ruderalis TaxID=1480154 RepID=A0A176WTK7_MARPO|nr:hypothetical protein AXG93_1356s1140 [Marchantia polymorpha subsp. ruderalis]
MSEHWRLRLDMHAFEGIAGDEHQDRGKAKSKAKGGLEPRACSPAVRACPPRDYNSRVEEAVFCYGATIAFPEWNASGLRCSWSQEKSLVFRSWRCDFRSYPWEKLFDRMGIFYNLIVQSELGVCCMVPDSLDV